MATALALLQLSSDLAPGIVSERYSAAPMRLRIHARRCMFAALAALAAAVAFAVPALVPAVAFAANPTGSSGCITDTSQSDFQAGTANGCDLTATPGSIQLAATPAIDQSNTTLGTSGVGITTTTWAGQTFTPSVTGKVTEIDVNLFCSGCTGTTPNLTLSIRATSGGLPTGADLAAATITGFNNGAAVFYTATFGSPVTLTAGTQYAFVIRPTANPSPGTYALTRSGTATAGSDVYAGGTRVAGATSGTVWSIPLTGGVSTDAGFKVLMDTGFASSGTFVSSLKDAAPPAGTTPTWSTLSFDDTTPANTAVSFQVAASNSPAGPFTFVGPDGTAGTFFTSTGADLSQFDGFRYLEYEAFLSTTDSTTTPSIQDVQMCFDDLVPTSLAVGAANGSEGGTTDLTASLTGGAVGGLTAVGLSGKTVDFTLNGASVGSAVTAADGTATLPGVSLTGIAPGSHPAAVAASFAGDTDDEPSSGAAALAVTGVPALTSAVQDAATGGAWAGTEAAGAAARDTAVVTGDAGTPTGTVTYALFDDTTCTAPAASTETVALSGGGVPASSATGALAAGAYSYRAAYSGDGNYAAASGACEPFTVAAASGGGAGSGGGGGSGGSGGGGGGGPSGPTNTGPAAPLSFTVSRLTRLPGGRLRFHITLRSAGVVDVLETAWDDNRAAATPARVAEARLLEPASRRFTFARAHLVVRRSQTLVVTVAPNAAGRRLLAHHRYAVRIRLWVTYTATGHRQGKKGFYGIPVTG